MLLETLPKGIALPKKGVGRFNVSGGSYLSVYLVPGEVPQVPSGACGGEELGYRFQLLTPNWW